MVQSVHNGMLEVTWSNGRKILDSKNANYSYGSLQRVLEKSLTHVDLSTVKSVLVLGLGGGSVIDSLYNKFKFNGAVTAIEIDSAVIRIASDEFGISSSERLRIVAADAYYFVETTKEQFDLLIIDLFIDDRVPEKFYSRDFCERVVKLLAQNGKIIFNLGMNNYRSQSREQVIEFFKDHSGLTSQVHENIEGLSVVLIAVDKRK